MIPKEIHYCWFGGNPLPELAQKCIASWRRFCPDYTITEWNESNYDFSHAPLYVHQAYEAKRWAFVTDYVRLQIIYEHGGIYMDTDVELLKNLDPFLTNAAFFGFENEKQIATGLGFGAEKGCPILGEMMADYDSVSFYRPDGSMDLTSCPQRNLGVFLRYGLRQDNSEQLLRGSIHIYPKEFFCPKDYESDQLHLTENTVSIHHYHATWHSGFDNMLRRKREKLINKYGAEKGLICFERWKKLHFVSFTIRRYGWKVVWNKLKAKLTRKSNSSLKK